MSEISELLEARGWLFVDNSGDGGAFGFHMKPLFGGKYVLGISAGGKGTEDDYLYPADRFDVGSTDYLLTMYQDENKPLPVTPDEFMGADLADTVRDIGLFGLLQNALDVADWLEANLKS